MVETKAIGRPESSFSSTMEEIRADFARRTSHFRPLRDCKPFSPQAYNAISAIVLESLYRTIEEIDRLPGGVPYHSNLALISYTDLHVAACQYYFEEYERICDFVDSQPGTGHAVARPRESLLNRAVRKGVGIALDSLDKITLRGAPRVGWIGNTTFPWQSLASKLRAKGIRLVPAEASLALSIPAFSRQIEIMEAGVDDLHRKVKETINTRGEHPRIFGLDKVMQRVQQLHSGISVFNHSYEVVVTGPLSLQGRALTLHAQARGIPVITLHHGAHYLIFDEPFYAFYEGVLADAKVVYGSIEAQRNVDTLGSTMNLAGHPIQYFTRTDPLVRLLYRSQDIEKCPSLIGLRALYFASEFETARYGPYRDVHPSTYLAWQERLLRWLAQQTGRSPIIRLHPKRPTTRYDPMGYHTMDDDIKEVLNGADVVVIDYPTTPLAYIAATNKPVLFFDLGLRRLHPTALETVRQRCHYAATDLLHPDEGFAVMESDLSRQCADTFTPLFSLAPGDKDEVTAVADAVCSMLSG